MIQRILDFVNILVLVWVCMLLGLVIINGIIVPMRLPEPFDGAITNVSQVAISAFLVLLWLYLWRWMATRMFWRAIKDYQNK